MTSTKRFRLLPTEYGAFRNDIRDFFVEHVLPSTQSLLDPMAGTATLLPYCQKLKIRAHFNDLLPVHFFLNQAKTVSAYLAFKEAEAADTNYLARAAFTCMKPLARKSLRISAQWIEPGILDGLVEAWEHVQDYPKKIRPLLRAIILLCVRPYACATRSKNPTWLKPGGLSTGEKARTLVERSIGKLQDYFSRHYSEPGIGRGGRIFFSCTDVQRLSLPSRFDTVITSPPYCNRFDALKAYAPELKFLEAVGCGVAGADMIGTNRVRDYPSAEEDLEYIAQVAPKAMGFLRHTQAKTREGESDYYTRCYARFYGSLFRALSNVLRLVQRPGRFYVVVQDNIHRGKMNHMGPFVCDFFRRLGWRTAVLRKFLRHHMGMQNVSRQDPLVVPKHYEYIIEAISP